MKIAYIFKSDLGDFAVVADADVSISAVHTMATESFERIFEAGTNDKFDGPIMAMEILGEISV